ncbi:MAG: ABC transporter ATP-binding protein [Clostridiaceae bacterium]
MAENMKKKIENVVTLKDINLKYSGADGEMEALHDINLEIKEGEFICLLGSSGCGKSTLLNIIAGFLKPGEGEARMDNKIIEGPDWHKGVVFQSSTLYPWLSVKDNISFGLKMRRFQRDEMDKLTKEFIELVGLTGFENSKPYELSGGMKQRASLARVLVNKPRMILMDEPFGALDALTRQNMQSLIRKIWLKTNNTVFMITHDVDEALSLATRVIVMSKRPGTIISEFKTDFTYSITDEIHERTRYTSRYMELREEILDLINS